MNRMFYYARLNDNKVCVGFLKNSTKLEVNEYLVELPDENESLIYKKWQGEKGWTQETYEPSVDTIMQNRLNNLEEENQQLSTQVSSLETTLQNVNVTNETLVQSIAELTAMIVMLQTP